ncbi:MAG: phage major capsid protein [Peptoniphilus sp.]|uniref:phage major capsid protein n=1 Tax=Peptoniphilus sp. TaxID=1971214 RepID=UPI002A762589|nr:phage major capsid protein [Peptoniphilus sp.]MDY2986128.1 phage major capsid protein [Peptoniphilus sp.]
MLKIIMLNKRKKDLVAELEELRVEKAKFETREKDIEAAIDEAQTEEEKQAVEDEIVKFEEDKTSVGTKETELEGKIKEIDDELKELEEKGNQVEKNEDIEEERGGLKIMEKREMFGGLTRAEVVELTKREDVKNFFGEVRNMKLQTRGVKNTELVIPQTLVGILRENVHKYSKLLTKVWLRPLKGRARATIAGTIPEAVWTEACGKLNELDFGFNFVEVEGYKVGGFIPVCNATLEDATDVDLYNEIMYMLAQAIGLAIDKAILYGTGKKMPVGIVTSLAQKVQPENHTDKMRKWVDLSTTNILQVEGDTPEKLFGDLMVKTAVAKSDFAVGNRFFIMNETTYLTIQSKMLNFNAAGVIVSGMNLTMPIIGGEVILLPFVPNGDVITGYGGLYLLVERAGMQLAVSEHVQFIEDNTVFKGTARYDGKPVIREGFAVLNVTGQAPTTTLEFVKDKAAEI